MLGSRSEIINGHYSEQNFQSFSIMSANSHNSIDGSNRQEQVDDDGSLHLSIKISPEFDDIKSFVKDAPASSSPNKANFCSLEWY